MNILTYIDSLIDQGYSEENAEKCADCMFLDHWESDDDFYCPDDYYGD